MPKTIIIASGKGGVGKSTVALNLAVLLARRFKTGLIDADIYGPSLSFMLGTKTKITMTERETLVPVEKFGLKYVSVGAMAEPGAPILWRGPMLSKILRTFLTNTEWGELDYLVIDTPPGTGDVHITLCSDFNVDGAVLVTTAQRVSIQDVSRACEMFRKLKILVLGVIENMSCSNLYKDEQYIIGNAENTREFSKAFSIPVLGRVPFLRQISYSCDNSIPAVLDAEITTIYKPILDELLLRLNEKV
ncbi:Mrp/NBP35 family ATP-binding protein [Neorickettsia sennetsu]|uniref:Iron-sulfur cluster carrier protein n=1 Tax=Ehrlichia sennetsu (strain ATCC VR-367 / Miyayama) TaxID=222891 RepID=Q2GCP2_EHRS3|nr:Mrp/NBP35 family ATP-binding protein [Neorickettsia sennetsu]ABD45987.1 ATP-binding protein, Mrp/Nbp35 family [Neorickettsia sennetsu str. Miyayama]